MRTATLRYNFETASWEAVADWNESIFGSGTTPEEAVDALQYECNKHELWPKEDEDQHETV